MFLNINFQSVTLYAPQVGTQGYVVVKNDGTEMHVPMDPANMDYQAVQAWIAAGGQVEQG